MSATPWWMNENQVNEVNEQWHDLLAKAASGKASAAALRRGRRFVLIWAFGTAEEYDNNAEFRARIGVAEEMLDRLDTEATPTLS